jgi:outer membrane receptor protein involved in Fe transport
MKLHRGRNALTVAGAVAVTLAAAAAGAQTAPSTELGEVIVTAQKRAERIQDVPVAVSVVAGSQLVDSGSVQLTDYAAYVPGMYVDSNGTPGQSTISLRGIGPMGSSATVGIYIDEAPIGSSGIYNSTSVLTFDLMPYDVERIEVLRGPQGTLYGASSIGGQLKYVTLAPALDEFEGKAGIEAVDVTGGSSSDFNYGARISFPLAKDSLGLSLSYARRELPAYIDNVQTGERGVNEGTQEGGRVALLWQPSDGTSVTLSALRQKVDSEGPAQFMEAEDGTPVGNGLSTNLLLDEPFESQYDQYSATISVELGSLTLTSVTSYSDVEFSVTQDTSRSFGAALGGLLADIVYTFDQQKLTQEIRLASPADSSFEWLVGAFYTEEENDVGQLLLAYDPTTGDALPAPLNPLALIALPNEYQEYAAFVNATYKFTDAFHLSGGIRYARNDQNFRQILTGALFPPSDDPGASDEDVVTYSLSPEWHVGDDTMLYARVATGYRPGGPNVFIPGVPPMVDSDEMTSYELGVKATVAGGAVQLEAAAFYMDWDDIQLAVTFPSGLGGLANSGAAESRGVEGALSWLAGENFRIGLNAAYAKAELTEDNPDTGAQAGDRLPRTPEWSGALFADYSLETGSNLAWQFGGTLRYVGDRISDPTSEPGSTTAGSYVTLDLSAGLTLNDRWTIRAYARNATDEDGAISRDIDIENSALGPAGPDFIGVIPVQPRTIGLSVELAF